MRLFVALPVSAAASAQITALPRQGIDARWVAPADMHITLRFLGDTPAMRLPDLRAALARVKRPTFHVELDGIDVFRDHQPQIVYARVASTRKMNALCGDITDMLTPLGFDFGLRPFVPHVTIARLNRSSGLDAWLARMRGRIRFSWPLTEFALMQSAGEDGQPYKVLQTWPLR